MVDNVNHLDFEVEDKKFKVKKPTADNGREAQKKRNTAFTEAIKSGAILRSQLNNILRERDLWNDKKEEEFSTLRQKIFDAEKKLEEGGFRLSEAKVLALQIKDWRLDMRDMLMERSILDNETSEGQADNTHFNCLVSLCTFVLDEHGNETKCFSSMDDYIEQSVTPIGFTAAQKLASITAGVGPDTEKNWPENQFLVEQGFADKELRLINKDGHLVDREGRLINEGGNYVDKDGNFVDLNGNPIDKEGNYQVVKKAFLDDNDEPLPEEKEKATKKVRRPKKPDPPKIVVLREDKTRVEKRDKQ